MARNYTHRTIKTLFGEASTCAYPGCGEPLIFRDRGLATAIAEIAHIRSETPRGPRHDPYYTGDLDGPDNLLLLCGKHHRPVDRHESAYSIEELEAWKTAQRAAADGGTSVSEADLRSYQRLSDEERRSLTGVARLAQRVTSICRSVQADVNAIRAAAEHEHRMRAASYGPMWEVDEHGNQTPIDVAKALRPPLAEQQQWKAQEQAAWDAQRPRVSEAVVALEEEIAVLRMFAPGLTTAGNEVINKAADLTHQVGHQPAMVQGMQDLNASVSYLWRLANGEVADD